MSFPDFYFLSEQGDNLEICASHRRLRTPWPTVVAKCMLRAGRAWYSSLNRPFLTFRQFTASFVTPKRAYSTGKVQKGDLGSVIDMDKKEQTSVAEDTAQVGQAGGQSTPEKKKTGGRSMCSRCGRVLKVCVCSVLPREKVSARCPVRTSEITRADVACIHAHLHR